ncbi:hypothetical protein SFUMM280S_07816 [Streptomyces fumanus]
MNPSRSRPVSPRAARPASATADAISHSARRAGARNAAPAAVGNTPAGVRSKRRSPTSRSRSAICRESDGWAMPSDAAARPKCWCSATARAYRR